ncbi:MAG: hypothetical protein LAP85_23465 [Acidobacteriia bacterium]|nr:hypothetical protein [Terriglobia bacterium]
MTSLQRQEEQKSQTELTGCMPLFLRLTWMALGNAALFLCAALVAKGTAPVVMDIIFFAVTIVLIVVRYIDITRFKGQTSEGKPATLAHWRRYALLTAVISTGIWVLARIAYFHKWL